MFGTKGAIEGNPIGDNEAVEKLNQIRVEQAIVELMRRVDELSDKEWGVISQKYPGLKEFVSGRISDKEKTE